MKLREGTKGSLTNIKVIDFRDGIEVEHSQTVSNAANNELTLSKITIMNATTVWAIKDAGSTADSTSAATKVATGIDGAARGSIDFWTGKAWVKPL